jgi:hypothetical protein
VGEKNPDGAPAALSGFVLSGKGYAIEMQGGAERGGDLHGIVFANVDAKYLQVAWNKLLRKSEKPWHGLSKAKGKLENNQRIFLC